MRVLIVAATLAWLGPVAALAQPLEQNFSFGAPPDVLGNAQPHGVTPQEPAVEAPPPRKRRIVAAKRPRDARSRSAGRRPR